MLHINKYPKSFIALSFSVSIIPIIDLVIESAICKYKYSQSWNDYSTGNTNVLSYNNIDYQRNELRHSLTFCSNLLCLLISSVALIKYYTNPLNSSIIKFSALSTILSLGVNFGLRYCSLSLLYNDSEECGDLIKLALERSTNDFNKLALEERNQDALKNLLKTEFDKLFTNVDTSNVFNKLSHVLILNVSIVDNKLNSICSVGEKIDLEGSIDVTKPLFIHILKIHLNHSVFKFHH